MPRIPNEAKSIGETADAAPTNINVAPPATTGNDTKSNSQY